MIAARLCASDDRTYVSNVLKRIQLSRRGYRGEGRGVGVGVVSRIIHEGKFRPSSRHRRMRYLVAMRPSGNRVSRYLYRRAKIRLQKYSE